VHLFRRRILEWQCEFENGTVSGARLDSDFSTIAFDDFLADG
jgi:hypothetical protein